MSGGEGGSERRKDGSNISNVPLVSSQPVWVNNNTLVQSKTGSYSVAVEVSETRQEIAVS
jgi:hypothetical protein